MARKTDMTVAEAMEKRQMLLDELNSDAHYERTETTYYGSHNPFDVPLMDCDTCNVSPNFKKDIRHNNRWNISCPRCRKSIQHPQVESWKALLLWWQKNLSNSRYLDLPMFGLATLDVPAARRRIAGIRRDLEIKKGIIDAEELLLRIMVLPPSEIEDRSVVDAYMGWAMLALALLKREDGGTQRRKNDEYNAQKNIL